MFRDVAEQLHYKDACLVLEDDEFSLERLRTLGGQIGDNIALAQETPSAILMGDMPFKDDNEMLMAAEALHTSIVDPQSEYQLHGIPQEIDVPVLISKGVFGHEKISCPLPLGTETEISYIHGSGNKALVTIQTNTKPTAIGTETMLGK